MEIGGKGPMLRKQMRPNKRRSGYMFHPQLCLYLIVFLFAFMIGNQIYLLRTVDMSNEYQGIEGSKPQNKIDPVRNKEPNNDKQKDPSSTISTSTINTDIKGTETRNKIDPLQNKEPNNDRQKHPSGVDRSEDKVFANIIERSSRSKSACDLENKEVNEGNNRSAMTDVKPLPEFGLASYIKDTLDKESKSSDWGQCTIPPETMCDVEKVSVIIMAYNDEGLKNIVDGFTKGADAKLWPRNIIGEIILVWNGPDRESLESSKNGKWIMNHIKNKEIPMRFFISVEHGLENNLLNRYHPLVNPKYEAILFFGEFNVFCTLVSHKIIFPRSHVVLNV